MPYGYSIDKRVFAFEGSITLSLCEILLGYFTILYEFELNYCYVLYILIKIGALTRSCSYYPQLMDMIEGCSQRERGCC
jgi:hypothetical protein